MFYICIRISNEAVSLKPFIMLQVELENKDRYELMQAVIAKLTEMHQFHPIVNITMFHDSIDEKFHAIIFYHE